MKCFFLEERQILFLLQWNYLFRKRLRVCFVDSRQIKTEAPKNRTSTSIKHQRGEKSRRNKYLKFYNDRKGNIWVNEAWNKQKNEETCFVSQIRLWKWENEIWLMSFKLIFHDTTEIINPAERKVRMKMLIEILKFNFSSKKFSFSLSFPLWAPLISEGKTTSFLSSYKSTLLSWESFIFENFNSRQFPVWRQIFACLLMFFRLGFKNSSEMSFKGKSMCPTDTNHFLELECWEAFRMRPETFSC